MPVLNAPKSATLNCVLRNHKARHKSGAEPRRESAWNLLSRRVVFRLARPQDHSRADEALHFSASFRHSSRGEGGGVKAAGEGVLSSVFVGGLKFKML